MYWWVLTSGWKFCSFPSTAQHAEIMSGSTSPRASFASKVLCPHSIEELSVHTALGDLPHRRLLRTPLSLLWRMSFGTDSAIYPVLSCLNTTCSMPKNVRGRVELRRQSTWPRLPART